MKTFTEQELNKRIEKTERLIISRAGEFQGEIGQFQWFLKRGIAKELHAMTTTEYDCAKPTISEFENLMFNIEMLNDMFEKMCEREYLFSELEKIRS